MAENAKKDSIQTTTSGLQYQIIHSSNRPERPQSDCFVRMKYTTWMLKDSKEKNYLEQTINLFLVRDSITLRPLLLDAIPESSIYLEKIDHLWEEGGREMYFNSFIAGVQEGLSRMPIGSVWRLYIPYNLAYGRNGEKWSDKRHDYRIKPYSVIIFEVEILGVR